MNHKLITSTLAMSLFVPCAFASPYIGIEAIQIQQRFKAGFGKKQFSQYPQSYNAFAGFKLSNHFGLEAGYELQPKTILDKILVAGDQLPGQPVLVNNQSRSVQSYYYARHPYLGFFAEYHNHFTFQFLLGASAAMVTAHQTLISSNIGNYDPPIINRYYKSKVIPIVKISATGYITRNLGIRLSINYKHMGGFAIVSENSSFNRPSIIKMQDAFGIGIGVKYILFKARH